jgi:hypothetical protein
MRVIGVPITLSIPIRSLDKWFFRQTLDGISGSVKVLSGMESLLIPMQDSLLRKPIRIGHGLSQSLAGTGIVPGNFCRHDLPPHLFWNHRAKRSTPITRWLSLGEGARQPIG